MRRDRPQERAASWPAEHIKVLLALWTEAAVTHDLSSHGRNRAVYDGISQRLAEMGIYRTGDQCREKMKGLKVAYRKAKENNSVGRPPIKCPFYDEIDQIMTQYINCRPGFPSEAGEGSSVTADRQEGLSISEPWGGHSSISERWGSHASGHWLPQTAASESQGTDEFSYVQAESQDAFSEIQVIPVQVKEEESEDEISPELDVSSPIVMETQPVPRHLISMLDQRPHLRTRKQKAQGDGQSGYQRGTGQKYNRSHQVELQRMQRQVASQVEEKQSLAEFIQHDKEMRREDREFQAQLFEKLFQKQTELIQALTQRPPPSPTSTACTNVLHTYQVSTKNGAGTTPTPGPGSQLQALLEQIMQAEGSGKGLTRLAVKEALGGAVKVPPEVQYWTAEEILRWLLSQQSPGDQCQEVLTGPRQIATRMTSDDIVADSPHEERDEDQRQSYIKDSQDNPMRGDSLGTEAHLRLRKRPKPGPREWIVPKQDGEHEEAATKQRKLDKNLEDQETVEAGEKVKQIPSSVPGKQSGKPKPRGRPVPGCNASVTGESYIEGGAKIDGSGRGSEGLNGVLSPNPLNEQKGPAGLGPSRLVFDKVVTVSGSQRGHDGRMSPEVDGPSLSDSIDILLDSPWSGNGSGDTTHDGPSGPRMLPSCASCTMLKAELDTLREELRLTQASTLYGLSGTALQDLSEALGTIVHILNSRKSLSTTNESQNVTEIPSRPGWRERNQGRTKLDSQESAPVHSTSETFHGLNLVQDQEIQQQY
ncbi:hypothetical protein JD844_005657 [Phrynosoma platyrhinos]|uniref:Myb/SANT-like DNA-binding domain-containing protein n=1 Tax=Phrynosoma platyrhinos TaxID=52577 RepID=A0ABQ7TNT1_PHRPL|nr:hypothetical protein JD844_005657 [Phrynosoma platyrhinos]